MTDLNQELWIMKADGTNIETITRNGVSIYGDSKIEDYRNKGFLILNKDEAIERLNNNQERVFVTDWSEISEKEFYDLYECLPPLKNTRIEEYHFFFISEPTVSNIHACFCEVNSRYYTAGKRLSQSYHEMIKEIEKIDL